MQELSRTRDCVVLYKGDAFAVSVDGLMRQGGWQGGQGVQWIDSARDEFAVTYSDGQYGGFLLWGSNESSDQFISMVEQQPAYGYGIFCMGGWLILTRTFEQHTWASRTGGGPLVPVAYAVGDRLRFSLRGFWTKEDEWTLSGDPRAPNEAQIGTVVQAPVANAIGIPYLTIQTNL